MVDSAGQHTACPCRIPRHHRLGHCQTYVELQQALARASRIDPIVALRTEQGDSFVELKRLDTKRQLPPTNADVALHQCPVRPLHSFET